MTTWTDLFAGAGGSSTGAIQVPNVQIRIAAGMAFPADYKWQPYDGNKHVSNRDLVKAAGNAVTPPAARDLVAAAVASLGEAA